MTQNSATGLIPTEGPKTPVEMSDAHNELWGDSRKMYSGAALPDYFVEGDIGIVEHSANLHTVTRKGPGGGVPDVAIGSFDPATGLMVPLAVASGGTGAITPEAARAALELDYCAFHAHGSTTNIAHNTPTVMRNFTTTEHFGFDSSPFSSGEVGFGAGQAGRWYIAAGMRWGTSENWPAHIKLVRSRSANDIAIAVASTGEFPGSGSRIVGAVAGTVVEIEDGDDVYADIFQSEGSSKAIHGGLGCFITGWRLRHG